jgi:hypothetical protein
MKYRRLTAEGDYSFGRGRGDYLKDAEAAAQAVRTKLLLLLGEWWEDTEDGLPLFESILGVRMTPRRLAAVEILLRERMLRTPHVTEVTALNPETGERSCKVAYTVGTDFGESVTGVVDMDLPGPIIEGEPMGGGG